MIPVLFQIGPVKVYSYGLMLGIAFLLGSYILAGDFRRKKIDPAMASSMTLIAVVFGVAGAKILHLIEEWDAFVQNPVGMAFSAGGLTWYGGFILAMIAATVYIRKKKVPLLRVWDSLGLALILAYGVGRVGCHLSGDGDYGTPTTASWGTIYALGTAKPSAMLQEYFQQNPEQRAYWKYDSLRVIFAGRDRMGNAYSRFDELTPLHPTPLYELLLGIVGFGILWWLRTRLHPDGRLFMVYLMLGSVFRFAVEFLRVNPRLFAGLSEAQLFSIAIFTIGLAGFLFLERRDPEADAKHKQ
jgi:phosphatidylglycerol---prolipoprotein diacylglyceryl transferase